MRCNGRNPRADETRLWQAYVQDVTRLGHKPQPVQTVALSRPPEPRRGPVLDLHGMTTERAYGAFQTFVVGAVGLYKYVTVVTGLSGSIRREFEHWIANHPDICRSEMLNGGGAFRLYLRK